MERPPIIPLAPEPVPVRPPVIPVGGSVPVPEKTTRPTRKKAKATEPDQDAPAPADENKG